MRVRFWEMGDSLLGSELENYVLELCSFLASVPLHPTSLKCYQRARNPVLKYLTTYKRDFWMGFRMEALTLSCLSADGKVEVLWLGGGCRCLGTGPCASSCGCLCPSEASRTAVAHELSLADGLGSWQWGGPTQSPALCTHVPSGWGGSWVKSL